MHIFIATILIVVNLIGMALLSTAQSLILSILVLLVILKLARENNAKGCS